MEIIEKEVVQQPVEITEIKELDVSLLSSIGGGCGQPALG